MYTNTRKKCVLAPCTCLFTQLSHEYILPQGGFPLLTEIGLSQVVCTSQSCLTIATYLRCNVRLALLVKFVELCISFSCKDQADSFPFLVTSLFSLLV